MVKITRRNLLAAGAVGLTGLGISRVVGAGSEVTEGRSRARPMRTAARPLAAADVVIIGGGNVGAATAYYLAKRGLSVILCEKGAIAGEASGRSVGHASSLGNGADVMEMARIATGNWPGLNAELQQETGYRQSGMLMKIKDEKGRAYWEQWIRESGPISGQARIVDGKALDALIQPAAAWHGGIFDPTSGRAEPRLLAPAYATAAQRLGAHIVAPCAVRGLDMAGGRVIGVVTEHGLIKTSRVVLAGGAWSTTFLRNLGHRLPTANLFSWCGSFNGVSGPAAGAIYDGVTSRPQIDGGYTASIMELTAPITPDTFRFAPELYAAWKAGNWPVSPRVGWYSFEEFMGAASWTNDEVSPFEKRRILEPKVNGPLVDRVLDQMRQLIPAFRGLKPGEAWGGVIDLATDQKPVIGPIAGISGLTVATALSNGLFLTPAVAPAIADIVTGKTPAFDIKAFQASRFD